LFLATFVSLARATVLSCQDGDANARRHGTSGATTTGTAEIQGALVDPRMLFRRCLCDTRQKWTYHHLLH